MARIYSNMFKVSITGSGGTTGGSGGILTINNYSVTFSCYANSIVVSGTVIYNNNPLPNIEVDIGFCSYFDFNTNQFKAKFVTTTKSDGSFMMYIHTDTPPGGANCIVAMVQYSGQTAVAQQTVAIPQC